MQKIDNSLKQEVMDSDRRKHFKDMIIQKFIAIEWQHRYRKLELINFLKLRHILQDMIDIILEIAYESIDLESSRRCIYLIKCIYRNLSSREMTSDGSAPITITQFNAQLHNVLVKYNLKLESSVNTPTASPDYTTLQNLIRPIAWLFNEIAEQTTRTVILEDLLLRIFEITLFEQLQPLQTEIAIGRQPDIVLQLLESIQEISGNLFDIYEKLDAPHYYASNPGANTSGNNTMEHILSRIGLVFAMIDQSAVNLAFTNEKQLSTALDICTKRAVYFCKYEKMSESLREEAENLIMMAEFDEDAAAAEASLSKTAASNSKLCTDEISNSFSAKLSFPANDAAAADGNDSNNAAADDDDDDDDQFDEEIQEAFEQFTRERESKTHAKGDC